MTSVETTPSESIRATIPQPVFERIQNEWRQMREQASQPRPAPSAGTSVRG